MSGGASTWKPRASLHLQRSAEAYDEAHDGIPNGLCDWKRAICIRYVGIAWRAYNVGILYITSTYDYPLLFQNGFTAEDAEKSASFYLSVYHAPLSVKVLIHSVFAIGMIGIVAKIIRWGEEDKYFGSISLLLYFSSLLMYVSIEIPNMRVLARPTERNIVNRAVYDADDKRKLENYEFYPLTSRERVSVVQVIGATNVIITALLAGVLLMQVGEWYATRLDRISENKHRQEMIAKHLGAERTASDKKEE